MGVSDISYLSRRSTAIRSFGVVCAILLLVEMAESRRSCFDVSKHPNWVRVARKNGCGVSKTYKNDVLSRIMGGTNAGLGEFPWMARLFYRSENKMMTGCGGSLIDEQFVLSAAHCCSKEETKMELVSVRLGEYDTMKDKDCDRRRCAPKHKDFQVATIYSHKQYDPLANHINDICLIKLEKAVRFSGQRTEDKVKVCYLMNADKFVGIEYIYPVCLPIDCKLQSNKFENTNLIAVGWGKMDEVYERPVGILQKLQVATVSRKKCGQLWSQVDNPVKIVDSQICAGREVGRDVCGGDSGGPLLYTSTISGKPREYVVGIVSYGQHCSRQSKTLIPGVYTNVASYLPWIFNIIGKV